MHVRFDGFKLSPLPEAPSRTIAVAVRRLARGLVDAAGRLDERQLDKPRAFMARRSETRVATQESTTTDYTCSWLPADGSSQRNSDASNLDRIVSDELARSLVTNDGSRAIAQPFFVSLRVNCGDAPMMVTVFLARLSATYRLLTSLSSATFEIMT